MTEGLCIKYVVCPHCGIESKVEEDTQVAYCINCNKEYEVIDALP